MGTISHGNLRDFRCNINKLKDLPLLGGASREGIILYYRAAIPLSRDRLQHFPQADFRRFIRVAWKRSARVFPKPLMSECY
jgi:hypothetical protein